MEHTRFRIAIASAQRFFLSGLRTLIATEPDLVLDSEVASFDELLTTLYRKSPDLVVLDAVLLEGISDTVRDLLEDVRLVLLVEEAGETFPSHWRALQVKKAEVHVALLPGLRSLFEEPVEEPRAEHTAADLQALARSTKRSDLIPGLTVRENEIVRLLAEGNTARSVATELNLSIKTVEAHKLNIMRKLNVHNRSALLQCAAEYMTFPAPARGAQGRLVGTRQG